MKPEILVDSISLLSPLTGIGRYTYEISKRIKEMSLSKVQKGRIGDEIDF